MTKIIFSVMMIGDNLHLSEINQDCFYVGNKVRDKDSSIFQKFSKCVLEEVKAKLVIAAHGRNLTY